MVPRDRSTTTDASQWLRLRSAETSRHPLRSGFVPGLNKRIVLGYLALLVGTASATTPKGLLFGVPLLLAGCYLVVRPLLAIARSG